MTYAVQTDEFLLQFQMQLCQMTNNQRYNYIYRIEIIRVPHIQLYQLNLLVSYFYPMIWHNLSP